MNMCHIIIPRKDPFTCPSKQETPAPQPVRIKDQSTLNKTGHFVNGIFSNTVMVSFLQPVFTCKTYVMNGLRPPFSITKLYSGMIANAASGGPPEGIAFLVQDQASKLIPKEQQTPVMNLNVSSFAGALGAPFAAAMERVSIIQQLHRTSAAQSIRQIVAKEGVMRGFSKGTFSAIGRDSLYNVGIFALSDIVRDHLHRATGVDSLMMSSAISGAMAGVLSTPCDLVKTVMQSDLDGRFVRVSDTVRHMVARHGYKWLFQGAGVRAVLVAGCTCTINWAKIESPRFFPDTFHNV